MNSIRNSLGMPETEIVREPDRLWNPHFYAISPKFITRSSRASLLLAETLRSRFLTLANASSIGLWSILQTSRVRIGLLPSRRLSVRP
jgi:hypothetical protein